MQLEGNLILSASFEGQELSNLPHKFDENYTELIGVDKCYTINSYEIIGLPDPHDLERGHC